MYPTLLRLSLGLIDPTPKKKKKRARRSRIEQGNTPRTAPIPAPRVAILI